MAHPKKKRGFREITVNGVTYRWRVGYADSGFGLSSIAISVTLQGPKSSHQQLVYRFHSIFGPIDPARDGSFAIRGHYTLDPDAPTAIKPRFVRQAILYGLEHGWKPDKRVKAMVIDWNKTLFDEETAD